MSTKVVALTSLLTFAALIGVLVSCQGSDSDDEGIGTVSCTGDIEMSTAKDGLWTYATCVSQSEEPLKAAFVIQLKEALEPAILVKGQGLLDAVPGVLNVQLRSGESWVFATRDLDSEAPKSTLVKVRGVAHYFYNAFPGFPVPRTHDEFVRDRQQEEPCCNN